MLELTVIIGLILFHKVYFHLKYHIIKFETGRWRFKYTRQGRYVVMSFYKWLYTNDLEETNRRLEEFKRLAKEDPARYKEILDKSKKK